uniref:ABC transmembrane type-1 domain-containing protein n=1 Tax=Steinernema glaseri TaxID=37863 RepID=A0A1I7Y3M8_9BILA
VIVQAIVICLLLTLGGVLFIGLQLGSAAPLMVTASLIGYQVSCGAGGIVYLIVNTTIRKEVFKALHITKRIRRATVIQQRCASNYTRSTH